MAIKLQLRLQDALQDLQEFRDNLDPDERKRIRDVDMSIRAVEDAIELHKALELAASPMRELLYYSQD
jgi:hypothetical protein